jgi:hypothetical protein
MFFVFLNLLEFALVNSYMRQAEKYEKMARTVSKRNKSKGKPQLSQIPLNSNLHLGHPRQQSEDDEAPLSKESIYLYSQNGGPRHRITTESCVFLTNFAVSAL